MLSSARKPSPPMNLCSIQNDDFFAFCYAWRPETNDHIAVFHWILAVILWRHPTDSPPPEPAIPPAASSFFVCSIDSGLLLSSLFVVGFAGPLLSLSSSIFFSHQHTHTIAAEKYTAYHDGVKRTRTKERKMICYCRVKNIAKTTSNIQKKCMSYCVFWKIKIFVL